MSTPRRHLEIVPVGPEDPEHPAARVTIPGPEGASTTIGMVDALWYAQKLMHEAGNTRALVHPEGEENGLYDPETNEDWRYAVLHHILAPLPSRDDYAADDPQAWRLAYACLTAREGTVEPPEVLADVLGRLEGLEIREETLRNLVDQIVTGLQALRAEVRASKQGGGHA